MEKILGDFGEKLSIKNTIKSNIVYKSCQGEWIVILEKLKDTKTNEDRTYVNNRNKYHRKYNIMPLTAKFRADKLKVLKIINKFDPTKTTEEIESSCYLNDYVIYKTGEVVYSDAYESDINIVCGAGLHYYKTILPAYYLELDRIGIANGKYKKWYSNGQIQIESNYKDGKLHGEYIEWYQSGSINIQCNYKNGKLHGSYKEWHENVKSSGHIKIECYYKNGLIEGIFREWYNTGAIRLQCGYKNGKNNGQYRELYLNYTIDTGPSFLYIETNFKNGEINGPYREWYQYTNGTLQKYIECDFKNGEIDGPYMEWFYESHVKWNFEDLRADYIYNNGNYIKFFVKTE